MFFYIKKEKKTGCQLSVGQSVVTRHIIVTYLFIVICYVDIFNTKFEF